MQAFINMAASQFGIDPSVAQGLAGAVLGQVKENADAGDFGALQDAVPGVAEALAADAGGDSGGGGGGLMGGLLGGAVSALGGGALGDAMGLVQKFSGAGLDTDQAGGFAKMLFDFLKSQAGEAIVGKLMQNAPSALSALLK
jgi:hypothetical protein